MTDHPDPDAHPIDETGRAAARGLHAHVARHVDPERALAALPTVEPPRGHGRLLAAAAVAALLFGSVAVLGDGPGGGDDRSRLEVDEDGNKLPAPEPGTLTPMGPNDGRDSIQLPVTVQPNAGLNSGDVVHATGHGFAPGERVGIVMCANEAGGDDPERRAGIDACNINPVTYADADADGVASGDFTVTRVLTTGATGTVDCAAEANRCIIAMGALNDYDRSGGFGLTFVGGGEPIDIPAVTVSPAEGLADGDIVHVEGEGFEPNSLVTLSICSIDPSGCWSTGEEIQLSADDVRELGLADEMEVDPSGTSHLGLVTDDDGRLQGDVPVWRYLPAVESGSYIDCAVSECSLRVEAYQGSAPPPPTLGFTPGGPGPIPPAVAVDPTEDLSPGDDLVVRGVGFEPGAYYSISLCTSVAGQPDTLGNCISSGDQEEVDPDGGFAVLWEVPDPAMLGDMTATTACAAEGECSSVPAGGTFCDGVTMVCAIQVDAYAEVQALGPPQFPPPPIPITWRP